MVLGRVRPVRRVGILARRSGRKSDRTAFRDRSRQAGWSKLVRGRTGPYVYQFGSPQPREPESHRPVDRAGTRGAHDSEETRAMSEPVVVPDKDGWITLNVSRLVFPPWCCDCGAPTLTKQPFRVHHQTGFALIL